VASAAAAGALALVLAPLAFLLSFKMVLGTSFLGAVVLGIVALIGYAAMVHFIGEGISVGGNGVST
jgi:hypothetical protein